MKNRSKSNRESIHPESKSRKVSREGTKPNPKPKQKDEAETRKYLLKTLSLLQHHLKLDKL